MTATLDQPAAELETAAELFVPNTLVAYKGGGWDGCFFQWNFCFFDKGGNFHSIYHSGWNGCETREKLEQLFNRRPQDFEFTDTTDPADVERFADREAVGNVIGTAVWFTQHEIPVKLRPKCDRCGRRCDAAKAQGVEYAGEGGVSYAPQKIVCGRHHRLRD